MINERSPAIQKQATIPSSILQLALHWNPQPVKPPQLDPEFDQLSMVPRIVEVIRYRFHSCEYGISPDGLLQEWRRFWFRLAVIVGIAGVCLLPIVLVAVAIVTAIVELLSAILTAIALIWIIMWLFSGFGSGKHNTR